MTSAVEEQETNVCGFTHFDGVPALLDSAHRGERPVAVVTGASAGVGRATAIAFARKGWAVAMIARGEYGLDAARQEVEQAGGRALVIRADVADPAAIDAAGDRIVAEWDRIDVWVNNAMATVFAPAAETTPAEFRRVTEVTYLGQVHGTLSALKHMRKQGDGTIVQVGSALAYRSIPLQSAYCAAKAAARGFTDSLRTELIHEGSRIRVSMVHLPAINTPQFDWARSRLPRRLQPVPPIYDPEVAARAILRAAGKAPRELWVGSPTIQAILGMMVAPGLLDRLIARRAWDGQMTGESADPRSGNLFQPVADNANLPGRFIGMSKARAITASASSVRGLAGLSVVGLVIAAATLVPVFHRLRKRSLRGRELC
ncbi:SDR family oxidoreductase [Microvirga brassicacearum]|uniref:SDR family oxidoreductase n=1 Tax=Microvirga brassicacearum TaxID=2580413 RepID=A0A5N3P5J7_9HYPH|nr:SDR family oxidoreductase [Microvirga brassicacearum]KAB0265002.1 SDR family oxidoreductase [Microvirga brassicacearum]